MKGVSKHTKFFPLSCFKFKFGYLDIILSYMFLQIYFQHNHPWTKSYQTQRRHHTFTNRILHTWTSLFHLIFDIHSYDDIKYKNFKRSKNYSITYFINNLIQGLSRERTRKKTWRRGHYNKIEITKLHRLTILITKI